MITVHPAGQALTHRFELVDGRGLPVIVQSGSGTYTLYDDSDNVVIGPVAVDTSFDPDYVDIEIAHTNNVPNPGDTRAFRRLVFGFDSSDGSHYESTAIYIVEASDLLEVGLNSFALFGTLVLTAVNLPELTAFHANDAREQKAALINAYYNIANLSVDFDVDGVSSTLDLTASDLAGLNNRALEALKRAQVIEANAILGGNPVEDRRRMGLISDSAGESAHFFRTSKPLDLPVSKATCNALRGYIVWGMKLGRG